MLSTRARKSLGRRDPASSSSPYRPAYRTPPTASRSSTSAVGRPEITATSPKRAATAATARRAPGAARASSGRATISASDPSKSRSTAERSGLSASGTSSGGRATTARRAPTGTGPRTGGPWPQDRTGLRPLGGGARGRAPPSAPPPRPCPSPVIARSLGAVPEIVRDGETGFLSSSPKGMAAAVERLGELDPGHLRQEAAARFDPAAMAHGYEALYQSVLGAL